MLEFCHFSTLSALLLETILFVRAINSLTRVSLSLEEKKILKNWKIKFPHLNEYILCINVPTNILHFTFT